MVKLTRIYTRGGDKGQTSLGRGERVAKHDLRVEAYGTVDETNSVIGLARATSSARSRTTRIVAMSTTCCRASRTTCSISAPISAR